MDEPFCADISRAAEEPLEGTAAPGVEAWIVLEHAGPWGPKGLDDSDLDPDVLAFLSTFTAQHPLVRVQLARRPEAPASSPRLFLSGGMEGDERLLLCKLGHVRDLLQLDLAAWLRGVPPRFAMPVRTPHYFVCVHGRRDRCCALRGMPVYNALVREVGEAVFQTTHLGGHRFAATLMVLPAGVCYGRMGEADVPALVAAHAAGKVSDLDRLRGRNRYAPAVQSAEISLRRRLSLHTLGSLRFLDASPEDEHVLVRFRDLTTGTEHTARVKHVPVAPLPGSCGAEPKPGAAWVELRLH